MSSDRHRPGAPADGGRLGIVLTGGGARASYQAGVLHGLGRRFPELRFPIVIGVSAGAINAAYLAAHDAPLGPASEALGEIWTTLDFDHVIDVDFSSLWQSALRWGTKLLLGGSKLEPQVRGLVDTSPLRRLLVRHYRTENKNDEVAGIARNLRRGVLDAVALITVNYGTGQTVTWVDGEVETWKRPERLSRRSRLTVDHVMASASLPLIFPAVQLERAWYGDGGIRLAAPLSPALHLGADRILAISTRYERSQDEADRSAITHYPQPAQILGNLLNAIFLDVLDRDIRRLERLNEIVRHLPVDKRQPLRIIDVVCLRPSRDLGKLAAQYESRLPQTFRRLTRGLGTRQTESPDFLSLLLFHADYTKALFEIGERDAEARADELAPLFEGANP